jgi:hypothetical protein
VGLEEGEAEMQALGELTAAGGAVEDQGPEDGDADPVAEDVDGSFDVVGEVGGGGGRHGVIVVVAFDPDTRDELLISISGGDPQAGRESVRSYGERWLARQVLAPSTEATCEIVLRNHASRPSARCG